MDDLIAWFRDAYAAGGLPRDMVWSLPTLFVSGLIVLAYGVITFKWYFQRKLAGRAESEAALRRLHVLVLTCAAVAMLFHLTDMSWTAWRCYDLVLLGVALHTWSYVWRLRGPILVEEHLARLDEVERSARKYREIAELLPHMVWTATDDGRIDFCNQRWSDFVGDERTWLAAIAPEDRHRVERWWNATVASREPGQCEVRLLGAAGYRSFLASATPIQHGPALKWLGALADIEAQKLLVAEREDQNRRKTFLLNALSHDLRAPLNNVVLNAHLLRTASQDPEQVEMLKSIVENAVAAGELVTRLLDFARLNADERSYIEVFCPGEAVRQIVRRFLPVAENRKITLRVGTEVRGKLTTDRLKFERIVGNLVDNAIKYTESGSVTVDLIGMGATLGIRITDTGIGIPAQSVPHLFDEFYQVHNHERDRSKGFGMGLAICQSLARQLGGDVRLERTGPGGSVFGITLPGLEAAVSPGGGGRQNSPASACADPDEAGLCPV